MAHKKDITQSDVLKALNHVFKKQNEKIKSLDRQLKEMTSLRNELIRRINKLQP